MPSNAEIRALENAECNFLFDLFGGGDRSVKK